MQLWESCKSKLPSIVEAFNESSANTRDIIQLDKELAEKRDQGGAYLLVYRSLTIFDF